MSRDDRSGPEAAHRVLRGWIAAEWVPMAPRCELSAGKVARGRLGRPAADGSLSEPFAVDDVPVFECCTASGPAASELPFSEGSAGPSIQLKRTVQAACR